MATNLLLVVTGASRGLGRAIAVTFNRHPDPSIKYVKTLLIARSLSGLEETKTAILEQANSNRAKDISLHTIDLGDLDNLNEGLDSILETVTKESFDRIIFINNAGSLGKLGPCWESQSIAELRRTVDLNITSALWTSVKFAQFAADRENSIRETTIVNISSLAAVQAMPSMGIYSSGKAARDMYHECFAKELEGADHKANIKILNYAPGPLETDMTTEVRACESLDRSLKTSFQQRLVDPGESAAVMVRLVLENAFVSGSHVDFYDV